MATNQPVVTFREYPVNAGGLTLNCREAGNGLPVIFLESLRWGNRNFYDALARSFHLFILELVSGEAEQIEPAVREAAEMLAGDAYNLVGSSRGANIALRTVLRVARDPEPAESLVLLSPTAVRPTDALSNLSQDQWSSLLLAHPEQFDNTGDLPAGVDLGSILSPRDSDNDLEAMLPQVKSPTLAVFGTRDRLISKEAPSTYRGSIPNCHVSLVYDTAHLPAAERPEAVASAVTDFIENRETFVVNRHSSVINP
ncbi:MAG: alpha/beta hydrolase [Chloroflexota bacterium]|nr:alpha/beta hydrolase [Chloroflexota bacterium]